MNGIKTKKQINNNNNKRKKKERKNGCWVGNQKNYIKEYALITIQEEK